MYYILNDDSEEFFESKDEAETYALKENIDFENISPDLLVDSNIELFERRIILKKKYKNRNEIDIYTKTSVRNEVLFFIDSKGKVQKSELDDFLKTKLSTNRGKPVHRSWIHKFARYFKVDKKNNSYTFSLSSLGKDVVKKLKAEGYTG